jgi:hypothetical protein
MKSTVDEQYFQLTTEQMNCDFIQLVTDLRDAQSWVSNFFLLADLAM